VGFFLCKERSNTKDPTDGKAEPTDQLIAFEYLPVVEVRKAQHPTGASALWLMDVARSL
jgi:hypothetical protein